MELGKIGSLMLLFVGIIIALSIVPAIMDSQTTLTTKNPVVNETLSIATARNGTAGIQCNLNQSVNLVIKNAPTGWKISDCPIESFVMKASNGTTMVSNTDYVFTASSGTVNMKNTYVANQTCATNVTTVNYNFCQDGYVTDSGGRTVAGLIALFAVLGLLGFVIFYAVKDYL